MKRTVFIAIALLACLSLQPFLHLARAKDNWTSVHSRSFLLIGNASEKEIRQVGTRLEEFREVFSYLFPRMNFNSPVPTTVIVFKSDSSYRPFKPSANTAGYFQPGPDMNYITLTTEVHGEQDPFNVIFHEYTHLLINNTLGNVPVWFNEGLAEYYSTFGISDDQKIVLGSPIASHVFLLRDNKMLPLRTLFQVDHHSAYYNERDKQSVFYAESWALMHYLILGNEGKRLTQLSTFLDLMNANKPMEQAFQQAFQVSFELMEKELRDYIKKDRYSVMRGHFQHRLEVDKEMQTAPVSEAEAQAYLGDLLLHSRRTDAEGYLQKALAIDPNLAMANAAMGMVRIYQGKTTEAREFLEKAITANAQNYLINYYHAFVLSREGMGQDQVVRGYDEETIKRIRGDLARAIELRPDYPESYKLLAFVNMVTNTHLDESVALLKKVLATSPGRSDLLFILAQVYLHKEDYQTARELLEKLSNGNSEARQSAQALLAQLTSREEQRERFRASRAPAEYENNSGPPKLTRPNDSARQNAVEVKSDPYAYLQDALRKPEAGEKQIQGILTSVDCDPRSGITFVIKVGEQIIRLRTASFENLQITTFTSDVAGEITCGVRNPENVVVICYTTIAESPKGSRVKIDGTAKSLDFVPKEFKLKANP